jgi:hypothetical protein
LGSRSGERLEEARLELGQLEREAAAAEVDTAALELIAQDRLNDLAHVSARELADSRAGSS